MKKPILVTLAEIILICAFLAIMVVTIAIVRGDVIFENSEIETTEIETETFTEKIEIFTQNETETQMETEIETNLISMGVYTVTAYCSCEKCCGEWANIRPDGVVYGASGEELIADYSIATDVELIPYGETIWINDQEYIAHDCGGAIQGKRIDIYMSSHEKALEWGVQNIEIFRKVSE